MSKYILRKHVHGFTSVSNNVIKALKDDLEALGFYLFILSLPDNWEFYKTFLAKECKIGIKKLERILKKLGSFGLVQYGQKRDEHGRFSEFYLDIYDLETLKINELEKSQHVEPPVGQNCRTVETVGRSGEAIKETLTKETLKTKKEILRSSDDEPVMFNDFWNIYPRKQKRKPAMNIWKRKKYDEIAPLIMANIKHRLEHEWKGKSKTHIPLPDTYLNQERWTDELIEATPSKEDHPVTKSLNNLMEKMAKGGSGFLLN